MFVVPKYFHFSHLPFPKVNYCQSNLLNLLKNMPKDPTHIAEAQRQRIKAKEKLSKYVPGKVTLQVLGTGALGAPKALYMFSDQSRYLFNCGEGTQRLAHEHKMKLAKLEHIFITQPVWRNLGGLPGIALTIQDVGVPEITLHGPPGLNEIFNATKRFVVLKDLKICMAECSEDVTFEDNVMKVVYVPLLRLSMDDEDEDVILEEDEELGPESGNEEMKTSEDEQPERKKVRDSEVEAIVDMLHASTSTRKTFVKKRNRKAASAVPPRSSTGGEFDDDTDYYAYERKPRKNKEYVSRYCYRSRPRSRSVDSANVSSRPSSDSSSSSTVIKPEPKLKGVSMSYICTLRPRPGALNLDKCVRMGVRPGPLLGKLKAGEDVKLHSGKIVSSKEVCEPEEPGLVFIVVDCPNIEYLDSLYDNEIFRKYQKTAENEQDIASLVVHFTPKEILLEPRYQAWMEMFPASTTQLMLNEHNTCMGSEAVHRIQHKLNLLSNDIFPLLGDKGTVETTIYTKELPKRKNMEDLMEEKAPRERKELTENELKRLQRTPTSPTESIRNLLENIKPTTSTSPNDPPKQPLIVCPQTFCAYHLRPRRGLDRSMELTLSPKAYVDECLSVSDLTMELRKLKIKMMKKTTMLEEYPKVLFLGTGSCIPNKTRNTSGILLSFGVFSQKQHILMDCGEGTYGQIIRFFGPEEARNVLVHLDAIYISHLHADHHIGLIGVLQGRKRAFRQLKLEERPIYLFAPKQIMTWLSFYDKCFESILSGFELVPNSCLLFGANLYTELGKQKILDSLNISDINTCVVKHCPNAFGVSIICKNGYKVTYSGDTMPSDNLVSLGMCSHILIHEATMEDDLCHEAIVKMHSTTSQAIQVGKRMKAKHIILTHFSQRYAKLPRLTESFGSNVSIAFDNMQVRMSDLSIIPELYPALKVMFQEHYEELENKALKRQIKSEREKHHIKHRKVHT